MFVQFAVVSWLDFVTLGLAAFLRRWPLGDLVGIHSFLLPHRPWFFEGAVLTFFLAPETPVDISARPPLFFL